MRKRRLGADQLDHEHQGVRQRHRLGVAVTCRCNNRKNADIFGTAIAGC
jgi:hypothetical protein